MVKFNDTKVSVDNFLVLITVCTFIKVEFREKKIHCNVVLKGRLVMCKGVVRFRH